MSYSFTAQGTAEEIGKRFDEERGKCASYGMIEPELRDIDEARDFVMQIASTHGSVSVQVSGHWRDGNPVAGNPAEWHVFARVSVTIDRLAEPPKSD